MVSEIKSDFENYNTNTAIKKIESLEKSSSCSNLSLELYFYLNHYKIRFYFQSQKLDQIFPTFHLIEEKFNIDFSSQSELIKFLYYSLNMWISTLKRDFQNALPLLEKSEQTRKKIENLKQYQENSLLSSYVCQYYLNTATYFGYSAHIEEELQYNQYSLSLAMKIGNNHYILKAFNELSNYFYKIKDFHKALNYRMKSVEYFTTNGEHLFNCKAIVEMSSMMMDNPYFDLKAVLKYKKQALKIADSLPKEVEGNVRWLYHCLNGLGIILSTVGKLTECFDYCQQAIDVAQLLYEKYDDIFPLSQCTGNIGQLYYEINDFKRALFYYDKSLILRKGTTRALAESYYQYVKIFLAMGDFKKAEENLMALERHKKYLDGFNDSSKHRIAIQFELASALLLIEKKTMITYSEAQIKLKKIISETEIGTELFIDAIIPLISLNIKEYNLLQNPETFREIKKLFAQFEEVTENTNSILLKIQAILLKQKLEILNGNFQQVEDLLDKAETIARENDLENLIKLIKTEKIDLLNNLQKMELLIATNAPMKERMEFIRLENYVTECKKIITDSEIKKND